MQQPLLQAQGISKRFGGLMALDNVDLTIRHGEILGVLGPNGAGKTTFVNCITGLDKPTGGKVVFKGEDITRLPGYLIGRRGIARTFQVVKPFKQLTIRDNVAVGAMFSARSGQRSAAEAKEYAEQILGRVGLQERMNHRASELTIADLKRLELGKALAMDPDLLFLDEVMAGLNLVEIGRAMELVQEINRSGVTIVIIEHVMKAVMGISNRLVMLHFGRKIAEGSSREIANSPEAIEAYLGERFARRQRDRGGSAEPVATGAQVVPPEAEAAAGVQTPPLLQITDLRAGYGDLQILWDVTLSVTAGEIVALIGANGAGKTTLLRTISQLIKPRGGRIGLNGCDCTDATADEVVASGVVHVPQGRHLFAGLTVKENLLQGAYLRKDAAKAKADLEWVIRLLPRLGERLNQVAGRLSGGEQQMCAIGRGLMGRPRLLLIDELSLGLAPKVISGLLELITQINRQGTAVLLVEQDVQVALEHAHRGYVLENGRIVKSGPAVELLDDPLIRRAYLGM